MLPDVARIGCNIGAAFQIKVMIAYLFFAVLLGISLHIAPTIQASRKAAQVIFWLKVGVLPPKRGVSNRSGWGFLVAISTACGNPQLSNVF